MRAEVRSPKLDARNSVLFKNLGIVNSTLWGGSDGDGLPKLVLAWEWGPICVYHNGARASFETTRELRLDAYTGWWRGVTTGDLNVDGRMDIIAANWGLNSQYWASTQQPLVFAYGELFPPGVADLHETEYVGNALARTRQFKAIAASMPFLRECFPTHR